MPHEYSPAAHYDRVTEAWGLLLGEELHYGLFRTGTEDLPTATRALTTAMIDNARLSSGLRVLDVGCGTGTPACRLATEWGVEVLGISTSAVGVAAAAARASRAGVGGVTFEVRDGTATNLDDAGFDRVWVMESSHLMPDRRGLFAECARVLRPGGLVVLCDIIRRRDIPFAEVRARRRDFAVLRAAFGSARMDTLGEYREYVAAAGLTIVGAQDLTALTLPTFDRWQDNLDRHRSAVAAILGRESVEQFAGSVRILRDFWQDGTLGYGLVIAERPG